MAIPRIGRNASCVVPRPQSRRVAIEQLQGVHVLHRKRVKSPAQRSVFTRPPTLAALQAAASRLPPPLLGARTGSGRTFRPILGARRSVLVLDRAARASTWTRALASTVELVAHAPKTGSVSDDAPKGLRLRVSYRLKSSSARAFRSSVLG